MNLKTVPDRTGFASAFGVAALALALGGGACKKPEATPAGDAAAPAAPSAAAPVAAAFAKVSSKTVPPRLEVTGTLDPDERSEVAAQTNAPVLAVNVDIGSRVKKNDVLVELDGREASLRLSAANASTEQQKARLGLEKGKKFDPSDVPDVKAAADARDLAKAEYDRAKKLFDQGAISQSAFDQAKSAKERAEAQYDMAKNGVEQSWAMLQGAQSQAGLSAKTLEDTKIRAPFDGVVVEKRISAGEFASAGRIVAIVVRDNPLRLRFDVSEASLAGLSIGQPVEISVAAFPGRAFQGTIKRMGATLKTQSRALPVEAEVPNDKGELKAGFFARGLVALAGDPKPAFFVPKGALSSAATGQRVFVKSGDRVLERLVVPGASEGDLVEVKGDIKVGDEVAVDHLDQLSDGAAIQ